MAEAVRAAVFFEDEKERKLAEETLGEGPGEATVFNGVVEGWGDPAKLEKLSEQGMIVEPLAQAAPPAAEGEAAAPAPKLLADLEQQAEPQAKSGDEAVYHIDLEGPITKEQRLEFDSFGVDIYMFVPPSRYRTFLTPDQLEKVKALPYVTEVTPYGFDESVTPALLDTVEEAQSGGGASLQSADGGGAQAFDCLLHRGDDLKKICNLIEDAEGTKVIGTSNLRVRFEAPVDAAFLAGLAGLPEVRKLAPFQAPTLL